MSHGPGTLSVGRHWLHKPLSPWSGGSSVGFCREGQSVMSFFFLFHFFFPFHFATFYVLKSRAEYKYCCFYQAGVSFLERERKLIHPTCCTFH